MNITFMFIVCSLCKTTEPISKTICKYGNNVKDLCCFRLILNHKPIAQVYVYSYTYPYTYFPLTF